MQKEPQADQGHYKVYGNGDSLVILIHGFLSSSRYWNKMRPSLVASGYKVVCIDLLGFGKATKPADIDYSYDDQVAYVHNIISHLAPTKPPILIGHSMGALIATRYAIRYPSTLESLTLLHPPLYKSTHEAHATLRETGVLYRHLLDSKYRNIAWTILRSCFPRIISAHTHYSRESSLKNVIVKAEALSDLKIINTKTLLLVGLQDRPVYTKNLRGARLSPSVVIVKKDVDHHSVVRQSALIQRLVLNFIAETKNNLTSPTTGAIDQRTVLS